MKLTAFVMATIQMIVTGMDSQPRFRYVASEKTFGFEMNWILQPCQTATPAAAIAKLPYQILQALVGAALGMVLRWKVKPLATLAGKLGETVG